VTEQPLPLIYDLDRADLAERLSKLGQPAFRTSQVWAGIYKHLAPSPEQISPLPKALAARLRSEYSFSGLNPRLTAHSKDRQTTKTLFSLNDGLAIETVLMSYNRRNTLCISTQAGCAMGCVFCATGQMGFKRNLTSGEILEQVLYYARLLTDQGQKVTNVVLMGMGEPFHNYDATMAAIDRLNDSEGFGLGARRFTVSTVGLVPGIRRFTQEHRQVNLAISLHAASDDLRGTMLPINVRYPLKDLMSACRDYVAATGRRLTFEWALIDGVNDTPEEAERLGALLKGLLCHVNVIPLNPTRGYSGARSRREHVLEFKRVLARYGIPCTVRLRRGIDIQAGCGQLAVEAQTRQNR
jgi:23S rRNA (adenine2503-C2)-methyltransferase